METPDLKKQVATLSRRCNLQVKAIEERDATIKKYEKLFAELQEGRVVDTQESEQTKSGHFFNCFQKTILKMIENNDFMVPLRKTENNTNYQRVEHSIFFNYVKPLIGEEEKEFINFCKSFSLIKVGAKKNIVFSGTSQGKPTSFLFINKSAVNYIKELTGDVSGI